MSDIQGAAGRGGAALGADRRSLPVPEGLAGSRLDVAVSRLFGLSRAAAAELVEAGDAPRPQSKRVE